MVARCSDFLYLTTFIIVKNAILVEVNPGLDIGLRIPIWAGLNLEFIGPILSLA